MSTQTIKKPTRFVRIPLPHVGRWIAPDTRVAITGLIVHEPNGKNPDDLYDEASAIDAYLEIELPCAMQFEPERRGSDWWVVDAMALVPSDLWAKVCELFAFIENDPGWESWKELER